MDNFSHLIVIMIVFGILGGIVNYFQSGEKGKRKVLRHIDYELLKSLFTGVAASLLVPLFLSMISSDIMLEAENDFTKMLIFCGFCLIASISSKAFIKTISNKVLERVGKMENDVAQVKKEVHPLIINHTEPEIKLISNPNEPENAEGVQAEQAGDKPEVCKYTVLKNLACSNFTFRTANGLKEECGMDTQCIGKLLEELKSTGLVGEITRDSETRFFLTEDGRKQLVSLSRPEGNEPGEE